MFRRQSASRLLGFGLLCALVATSCNRAPTYSTYEDCVLTEIGASQTESAVVLIRDACRKKFPLTQAELDAAEAERAATARAEQESWEAAAAAADAAFEAAEAAADEYE